MQMDVNATLAEGRDMIAAAAQRCMMLAGENEALRQRNVQLEAEIAALKKGEGDAAK